MTAFIDRRTALTVLIAAGVESVLPRRSFALGIDLDRYAAPVEITTEDIAWFRQCRSVWVFAESGAPAIVPPSFSLEEFYARPRETREARERLERTLCAFFVHARFEGGRHLLDPPMRAQEAFAGAPTVVDFNVSTEHLRLFHHTNWRQSTIDSKRPYGDYTYYVAEMAEALGIPVTRQRDSDGSQFASLPKKTEARLIALHRDMLFVLQAYLQHAQLSPGRYVIPFDGWDSWIIPRCQPATKAEVDAYLRAMGEIKRRTFPNEPAKVVPIFQANRLLFGEP
jgi:hypothetical protein